MKRAKIRHIQPLAARVLLAKAAGIKVPWDDDLRILETKEVLATVDEISPDQVS